MWRSISVLFLAVSHFSLFAQCHSDVDHALLKTEKPVISRIVFNPNNVFDLEAKGVFWLHRFANNSHIISKEQTIRDDLLFSEAAPLQLSELAETERLLRSRRYLRDAKVEVIQYCPTDNTVVVAVTTWDNWSLLPKIDFSREGGESKYSVGITEDNLLGSGNQIQLDYAKDSERSGYLVSFASPNILGSHWNTFASYANNSDGENFEFGLNRPFYRLDSGWAFNLDFLKNKEQVTDYLLDENINEYDRTRNYFESAIGIKLTANEHSIQRLLFGTTLEDVTFAAQVDTLLPIPADRNLSTIWLEYQLLQDDFYKLYNINQFNRVEDINAGWQLRLRLGYLQPWLGADDHGLQLQLNLDKAWQLLSNTWLFADLSYQHLDWQQSKQTLWHLGLQLNHQLNRRNSLVASISAEQGENLFADNALYLGGDSGLRAFPLYYQRGDNRMVATAEYRHYTDWNLWQIFDVGFAAFTDVGRSWGATDAFTEAPELATKAELDDKVLVGVGVGLRLLSSHSSRGTMVHLDLTRPFTDNPDISSWQWRVTAKRRF